MSKCEEIVCWCLHFSWLSAIIFYLQSLKPQHCCTVPPSPPDSNWGGCRELIGSFAQSIGVLTASTTIGKNDAVLLSSPFDKEVEKALIYEMRRRHSQDYVEQVEEIWHKLGWPSTLENTTWTCATQRAGHVYTYDWFMLICNWSEHNIVVILQIKYLN